MFISKNKIRLLLTCAMITGIGFTSLPAHAQVAAASLDHSRTFFFTQDLINPTLDPNGIFPQSTYALSPQASGWRKFSEVSISYDYYESKPKYTEKKAGVTTTLNSGKYKDETVNLGSSFIINRNFFLDINAKGSSVTYTPVEQTPKSSTDRTMSGGNVNFGGRVAQVLSVGVGVAQVDNKITRTIQNEKTELNLVEQTLSFGLSLRLGNFFIGLGGDLEVTDNGNIKRGSEKEVELKENRYQKLYGGLGLSMGHPRDTQLHIELDYLKIPQTKAKNGFENESIIRYEYTEYSLNSEIVYFKFYYSLAFKKGVITDTKETNANFKDHSFENIKIGFGFMGESGFFFTLKGGVVISKSTTELADGTVFSYDDSGSNGSLGLGIAF